jgi:hypothetical protein
MISSTGNCANASTLASLSKDDRRSSRQRNVFILFGFPGYDIIRKERHDIIRKESDDIIRKERDDIILSRENKKSEFISTI